MTPAKRRRKHYPITWVEQLSSKDKKGGCAIASLAMLLDTTYQAITGLAPLFCHNCGVEEEDLDQFLAEQGYAVQRRWRGRWFDGEKNEWPLDPWAERHIALVWQTEEDDDAHYVVIDSKGIVYDPADTEFKPSRLDRYHDVEWIAGVWKVGV